MLGNTSTCNSGSNLECPTGGLLFVAAEVLGVEDRQAEQDAVVPRRGLALVPCPSVLVSLNWTATRFSA